LLLSLHCLTNGRSTIVARRAVALWKPSPKPIQPFASMFGQFDAASMEHMAEKIRRDGYFVFSEKIPAAICDDITGGVRSYKGWIYRDDTGMKSVAEFEPNKLDKARYELAEASVWQIPAYQQIVADPIFVNLSQAYFRGRSILKELALWWSPAVHKAAPDAEAAQVFHFDYDAAPIWLKFFVYLNDVAPTTGPHVFVKGSHRIGMERSRELLSRGYVRLQDSEIANVYGADNIVEICGAKGTVIAVDTIGFHKGGVPSEGHRVLAQIEYATPLFVPTHSRPLPMPTNATATLLAARSAYPWAFARFPARVT